MIPTHAKKLPITVLYTYFNFCTEKEKKGKNKTNYSNIILSLISALGARVGKRQGNTEVW